VDPGPICTSPVESPRFDTPAPARTSKRPRESDGSPGPEPKSKTLRSYAVPTSPINSAVFPPITELPPILNRQGSLTVSSDQLSKKPRSDRVIKINPKPLPPAEASAADTSAIESFQTSPPKPPTTTERAGSVGNGRKPQAPVIAAVVETSFLTSPETSPEKRPTLLPPPPLPKVSQSQQVKNTIAVSTFTDVTSPENLREGPAPNSKVVIEPKSLLRGQTAKTIGITKLRPTATTISHEAGPSKTSSNTIPLRSQSTLGHVQKKKTPATLTKKGKDKPAKLTPVEYAEMLIEKYSDPNRRIPNVSQHLRGRKIFYVGVDMRYAGDGTKKKMEYVRTLTTQNLALVAHFPTPDSQAWWHPSPQI